MKSFSSNRKGKLVITLIVAIGIIVTLINVIQNVVVIGFIRNRLLNENIERYSELSLNYAKTIDQTLDEYLAKLNYYIEQDVIYTEDNEEIFDWLQNHAENRPDEFMYIGWVDAKGNMFTDMGNQTDVSDREYYKAIVINNKGVYVNNPVVSKTTNARVVHVAREVRKGGRIIGEIVGVINVDIPGIFLGKIDVNPTVCCTLFSGDGQFMGMAGNAELMGLDKADPEAIERVNIEVNTNVRQGKNGHLWVVTPGAPTTGMFYAPIKYTEWSVSLTLDQETILYLAKEVQRLMIIFSLIITISVITAAAFVLKISLKPLKMLESSIRVISTGNADLTKRLEINSNNEIGRVVDGFNLFSEKLQSIMASMKASKDELVEAGNELNQSTANTSSSIIEIISNIESMGKNIDNQSGIVNDTASAVNEIASNIESLNTMIEMQTSAVTQASVAVEEMIGNIDTVSSSVNRMTNEFDELHKRVGNGINKQQIVNDKISEVEIESRALQEANAVIASIAEQTNLLAMNAAIEAAHAGESGKGFSVVADEIRKLSENASEQSETIGQQLQSIQDSINEIVVVSQEAKDAFSLVSTGLAETNTLVRQISNSMDEQAEGSKQISIALSNMNHTSSEVQNSSQEMSAGNKIILEEIKKLQDSTFSMKAGMDEMSIGASLINRTGNSLSEISRKMDNSIVHIGGQVDQFRV